MDNEKILHQDELHHRGLFKANYFRAMEEYEDYCEEHVTKKRRYKFWRSEFDVRVDDLKKALRREDDVFWIKALRTRIRTMYEAMIELHTHAYEMKLLYEDILERVESMKKAKMNRYLKPDIHLSIFNRRSCKLIA